MFLAAVYESFKHGWNKVVIAVTEITNLKEKNLKN